MEPDRLRVFIDSDVLIAAAASRSVHSAGLVLLRLSEITIIDAVISDQVYEESRRNIEAKLLAALPVFDDLVERAVRRVGDPARSSLAEHAGAADAKDLGILVAALESGCRYLATFNVKDFRPGVETVEVLTPGQLVMRVREVLAHPRRRDPERRS